MAYSDKRIIQVLFGEVNGVPERYEGYRRDLRHLLGDVLLVEYEHAISRTSVVKKIADQVNTLGMSVFKSRPDSEADEGQAP